VFFIREGLAFLKQRSNRTFLTGLIDTATSLSYKGVMDSSLSFPILVGLSALAGLGVLLYFLLRRKAPPRAWTRRGPSWDEFGCLASSP
jgi:hypothetical protein